MEPEYHFYCDPKTGRHLLYVEIENIVCEHRTIKKWDTSFELIPREYPEEVEILFNVLEKGHTYRQREQMLQELWHKLRKDYRALELQYLPDYLLDDNGRLDFKVLSFYKSVEAESEKAPLVHIHYWEPYCANNCIVHYNIFSYELRRKFTRYQDHGVMIEISQADFQNEMATADNNAIKLRESYVSCFAKGNRFYKMPWNFPPLVDTFIVMTTDSHIPLLFFKPH